MEPVENNIRYCNECQKSTNQVGINEYWDCTNCQTFSGVNYLKRYEEDKRK